MSIRGKTVKVSWEVSDGYVGKSRPQSTTVDVEDFEDLDEQEIEHLLFETVQEDFDQQISWDISNLDGAVAEIKTAIEEGA